MTSFAGFENDDNVPAQYFCHLCQHAGAQAAPAPAPVPLVAGAGAAVTAPTANVAATPSEPASASSAPTVTSPSLDKPLLGRTESADRRAGLEALASPELKIPVDPSELAAFERRVVDRFRGVDRTHWPTSYEAIRNTLRAMNDKYAEAWQRIRAHCSAPVVELTSANLNLSMLLLPMPSGNLVFVFHFFTFKRF